MHGYYPFNSHPHKEDDEEAAIVRMIFDLSTHILTRRMTVLHIHSHHSTESFNSHPHKEDDVNHCGSNVYGRLSTHILTRRMTPKKYTAITDATFQLTSSQGG